MLPQQLGEIRFVHNPYSFQGEMHLWVPFKPENKEKDARPKTYAKPQPTVPSESPAPVVQPNHLHPCAPSSTPSFNPSCPAPQWQPQPQPQTSNRVAFVPQAAPMPTQSPVSQDEAARLVLLQTAASLLHHHQELAPSPQLPSQPQQHQARPTQKPHIESSSQTNTATTTSSSTTSTHTPGPEPQAPATPAPDAPTTKRVLNRKNAKKKDLAPDSLEPKSPSNKEKMNGGAGSVKKPMKVAEQAAEGDVEPPSSPTLQTLFAISKSSGMCCSHDPRRWKCLRVKLGVQHMICLECENRWRVPKSLLQAEGGQTSKKQSEASGSVKA